MLPALEETHMNLFQRYLAEEFAEDYQEGRLSRREALKLIVSVTGSLVAANSILAACTPLADETATSVVSSTDSPTAEVIATLDDPPTAESAAPVATSP